MPSFLYPVFTLGVFALFHFLLNRDTSGLKELAMSSLAIILLVTLLYSPVFLISGIRSVTSNEYVQRRPLMYVLSAMPEHFKETFNWLLSNQWGYIVAIILTITLLWQTRYHRDQRYSLSAYFIICCALPLLIIPAHSVIPFHRTWIHLAFVITLGMVLVTNILIQRLERKEIAFFSTCTLIILVGMINFHIRIGEEEKRTIQTDKLARFLFDQRYESVFVESDLTDVPLNYFYAVRGRSYSVDRGHSVSFHSERNYDLVVLEKHSTLAGELRQYKVIYEDDFVRVYKDKDKL